MRPVEIARATGISIHTISSTLGKLRNRGIVVALEPAVWALCEDNLHLGGASPSAPPHRPRSV